MGLVVVTPPSVLPVSLAEAKAAARVDETYDDAFILDSIASARKRVETMVRRTLTETTYRLTLDAFPLSGYPIELDQPPLLGVDSVQYVDTNGVLQTMAASAYEVDTDEEPGRVKPVYGSALWPTTRPYTFRAVRIQYRAGYGSAASSIPPEAKRLLLLLVAHEYENREPVQVDRMSELPRTIQDLVWLLRWGSYPA